MAPKAEARPRTSARASPGRVARSFQRFRFKRGRKAFFDETVEAVAELLD